MAVERAIAREVQFEEVALQFFQLKQRDFGRVDGQRVGLVVDVAYRCVGRDVKIVNLHGVRRHCGGWSRDHGRGDEQSM
ncbi:hypothetical protein D3C71_1893550 [compost metagenome]